MQTVNVVVTESVLRNLHRNRRPLGVIVVLFLALLLMLMLHNTAKAPDLGAHTQSISLGGKQFIVQIADTPELRTAGLSHRPYLNANEGMLFVFQTPDKACFWMKDMLINLDILWFDADKKLIYQQQNLAPATYPQSFCPSAPASYVVEVKTGTSQQLGLSLGNPLGLQKQ